MSNSGQRERVVAALRRASLLRRELDELHTMLCWRHPAMVARLPFAISDQDTVVDYLSEVLEGLDAKECA